ncbi:conserved hypothetical protein [Roseovarius sp. EC-HK134]|jgi:hypothetical protein|uniref:DUF1127 domain-containing protein n=1 Tax=Roseovarius mucosus TaxID=215743 RepID=A0A1V0RLA4_9RHOB|nr:MULTISPECIES: hypothetical protein [Roseovarius]ARE82486.1 hypothetical protein ROSMUCSMR3_00991 [Roseovarius mucosus]AWZ22564.1 Hypothetical protein RAK1035_3859 [Roseovarius sp. AK1035]EDM32295.1 hypothetical protein RTM1035_12603 [Roseovarius sp. TM1035]MBW4972809.1 DUF1127 domain-containing protein [Roseovarius mucosus]VVT33314.1 conserved hypothetical protein [Roseovarius sp. EC-SD190]|tara:strand:- start:118 stop:345 length:228 start_codon:yes stop_codon:yes gene_type:complete
MGDTDLTTRFMPANWRHDLDLFLVERAAGMNGYLLARPRLASVAHLQSLSASELEAMGLTRADIAAFVFEDILPD